MGKKIEPTFITNYTKNNTAYIRVGNEEVELKSVIRYLINGDDRKG